LEEVLEAYEGWVGEQRGVLGFNLAGLEVMGREARERAVGGYVDEGMMGEEDAGGLEKGRKKRGFGNVG